MDDELDALLVEVRADTSGFAQDIANMRGTFDTTLVDGFAKAGAVLEKSLLTAIRNGGLGFEDLKGIAFKVLDQIATQALQLGLDQMLGGGSGGGGGLGNLFGSAFGALFGLPGRAVGGDVSPHRPFIVGERGPELFVPTSAGRVEAGSNRESRSRQVNVNINLDRSRDTAAPVALQRSSRQVASAVRRALARS